MNFKELNIAEPILRALAEIGYTTPTPIQEKAIPSALQGRDILGCAQTGTGKTCAFAVPILQRLSQGSTARPAAGGKRPIRALILTPTRELALQIYENIVAYSRHLKIRSAVIFGGVSQAPQVDALRRGIDILVATPGRLNDLIGQGYIDLGQVECFVLDEADRMLDMGFIHDVRRVLTHLPQHRQTLFFSATMPPEIVRLVDQLLVNPVRVEVTPVSSTVDAIEQSVYLVDKGNKSKLLLDLLKGSAIRSALVFTRTKHGADKVVRDLVRAGVPAAAIHGNKSQNARQQALGNFKAGKLRVLVATDIAARGIDIEELSHVINYNLPNVPETYVHRIGRTGRAGLSGVAISFSDFEETAYLRDIEKLIGKEVPVMDHKFPMMIFELPIKEMRPPRVKAEKPARPERVKSEKGQARPPKKAAVSQEKGSQHTRPSTGKKGGNRSGGYRPNHSGS